MTRRRWIQDPVTHKLVPAEEYRRPERKSPHIMEDLKEYMPVAGDVAFKDTIRGRRQHREYLKRNNLQEVGNEFKEMTKYGGKTRDNHDWWERKRSRAGELSDFRYLDSKDINHRTKR